MIRRRLRALSDRYAVSAAVRVGPWCAGLQSVPPYIGVEHDRQSGARTFTIAAHVGVIDLHPETFGVDVELAHADPGPSVHWRATR